LLLTVPTSRYEQVQVVIGMKWTVVTGHRIPSHTNWTVAEAPTEPHHNAVNLEEHREACYSGEKACYGGEKDEHHRVEEAEIKREYVLMENDGDEKYSGDWQRPIARHHDLIHVLIYMCTYVCWSQCTTTFHVQTCDNLCCSTNPVI